MNPKFIKINIVFFVFFLFFCNSINAEIVKKIEIMGNDRISNDTIKLFSEVKINENLSKKNLNDVLKKLYDTNFFKEIDLQFKENILIINVE